MRTLYVRIIVITMVIMIASAIIAFAVTNLYYQQFLKPKNDEKITRIAHDIVSIYSHNNGQPLDRFLTDITDLGYKFYLVHKDGQTETFGDSFDSTELPESVIQQVFDGHIYHGIANYPWKPFVTGFFDNKLKNTIGIPINANGSEYALFVRPYTTQQFGEMRMFLAVLLVLVLLFSFLLILISTRFIVKPVERLTDATRKIAAGNYHVKLNVNRRDEIGRLASDFTKMSDNLQQTEEKRQEFVSNVSHEIQSPLSSIQGFSQLLREEEMTEEERKHYLTIIENESRRLSQLGKQLLTLSFLDNEMDERETTSIQLGEQLKEVVSAAQWLWVERGITVELEDAPYWIHGNSKLLHQVWMNLLTNAIRYTASGGTVRIYAEERQEAIDVMVDDNGIGIAKKDIPHLFDRFYKVDKARTRTENSTGLGLSIVKKIIELHNGTIMVESEPDHGTTFVVTLPKA
ncbi:sensor histidine kinase [Virgibacillus siamensis]|uniref:sensor histidine kinase n=1 Tax=Virgibacillus siamensis TaxID=480071 RepID=UPI000986E2AD|nr:HAMP domain-containing sensor histidine kinase [Virgibacillus siamensis]